MFYVLVFLLLAAMLLITWHHGYDCGSHNANKNMLGMEELRRKQIDIFKASREEHERLKLGDTNASGS